jgi:hypothetical protein
VPCLVAAWRDSIESMFDLNLLPGSAQLHALDDAGLMDSIIDATRLDSAVQARSVIAIGELWDRRKRATSRKPRRWAADRAGPRRCGSNGRRGPW